MHLYLSFLTVICYFFFCAVTVVPLVSLRFLLAFVFPFSKTTSREKSAGETSSSTKAESLHSDSNKAVESSLVFVTTTTRERAGR